MIQYLAHCVSTLEPNITMDNYFIFYSHTMSIAYKSLKAFSPDLPVLELFKYLHDSPLYQFVSFYSIRIITGNLCWISLKWFVPFTLEQFFNEVGRKEKKMWQGFRLKSCLTCIISNDPYNESWVRLSLSLS